MKCNSNKEGGVMKKVVLIAMLLAVTQLVFVGVARAEQEDLDNFNRTTSTKNAGVDLYGY